MAVIAVLSHYTAIKLKRKKNRSEKNIDAKIIFSINAHLHVDIKWNLYNLTILIKKVKNMKMMISTNSKKNSAIMYWKSNDKWMNNLKKHILNNAYKTVINN